MYEIDELDRVVPLPGAPRMDVGAPSPVVLANERQLFIAYVHSDGRSDYLADPNQRGLDPAWDRLVDDYAGETPFDSGDWDARERVVVIEARGSAAHYLGSPNDETLDGHPLASRGLTSYDAFTVEGSSWVRSLERRNRVHPHHDAAAADRLTHFILTFHDSTFECVARALVFGAHPGPIEKTTLDLAARLRD